jgi:hypothetical protein
VRRGALFAGTFGAHSVSIVVEMGASRSGCRTRLRYGACFAVSPEYVINIALRGSRDAPLEYSAERQRGSSRRIASSADGRSVRVLPALLVEIDGAKLQNDLRELQLLHVVFGLLLKPASP